MFGMRTNYFPDITIAGVHEIERLAATPFTQVISISDIAVRDAGGFEHRTAELFPKARVLHCYFNDIDIATQDGPTVAAITRVLDFSANFTKTDKILIHCLAGISRSTSLAFAIACQHSLPGEEKQAMEHLRKIRPQMLPNRLIVITADRLLKRSGRMIAVSTPRGL